MSYEEIFDRVVERLHEQRKFAVSGKDTIYVFTDVTFQRIDVGSIYKILRQLQQDQKSVTLGKIEFSYDIIDPIDDPVFDGNEHAIFSVEVVVGRDFDTWYETYLSDKLSDIENMELANVAVIYEVLLDLQEAVQLDGGNEVEAHLLSLKHRFPHLLPREAGYANIYFHSREQAFEYLLRKGIVTKLDRYTDRQHFDMVKAKLSVSKLIDYFNRVEQAYDQKYAGSPSEPQSARATIVENNVDINTVPISQLQDINTKEEVALQVKYSPDHRIIINDIFYLGKPSFNSENDLVFKYLCDHPNIAFDKNKLIELVKISITKDLDKIVENLGFTKDLRKVFFLVSNKSIMLRNPVSKKVLRELNLEHVSLK